MEEEIHVMCRELTAVSLEVEEIRPGSVRRCGLYPRESFGRRNLQGRQLLQVFQLPTKCDE